MRRAAAIVLVALLAAALGRLSAPSGSGSPPLTPGPGPTRTLAGVGVGYAHTKAGAALAAAGYERAFADAAVLRPGALRARIEAVATPDFAPRMLAANAPGARRLAAGALGEGLRAGVATVYLGVPVSYRLLSYMPSRAVVRIWGLTLLGNAASVEPQAYFGTARTVLVWSEGDWKIADTRAAFGPTPRLATPRRSGEGFGLIELTRELRPYGIAP